MSSFFQGIKRSPADAGFSEFIRYRDNWTCQRCSWWANPLVGYERARLHCSHFFTRANMRVRYEPTNAAAMCMGCHDFLGKNPNEHRDLWLKRLGQETFDALVFMANNRRTVRVDERMESLKWKVALVDLKRERGDFIMGARA